MDYNKEVALDADALAMFMDKVKDPKEKKAFQEAAKNAKVVKGLTHESSKSKKKKSKMKGVKPSPYLAKLQAKNRTKKPITKKVVTKKARKPKMLVFEAHYMTKTSKKTFTFQATDGYEIDDLKDAISQALKGALPSKDMLLSLYDVPLTHGTLRQCGIEDDAVLFVSDIRHGFDNHFQRVGGFLKSSGMGNTLDADVNDALYGVLGVQSEQEARELPKPAGAKKQKKNTKQLAVGGDYNSMSAQALRNLCEVRGIKVSTWDKRKLVELLATADEQGAADGTLERVTNREMCIGGQQETHQDMSDEDNKEQEDSEEVAKPKPKKSKKKVDSEAATKPKKSKKKKPARSKKKPMALTDVSSHDGATRPSIKSVEPPKTPAHLPPPPPAHASLLGPEPSPEPPAMSDDEAFPTTRPPNGSIFQMEDQKEEAKQPPPPPPGPPPTIGMEMRHSLRSSGLPMEEAKQQAPPPPPPKKKAKKAKVETITLDVQIGIGSKAKHKKMVLNHGVTAKALKIKIAAEEGLDLKKLKCSRANVPLADSDKFEQGDEVMVILPIEKKKKASKKAKPAEKPQVEPQKSGSKNMAAMWDKKIETSNTTGRKDGDPEYGVPKKGTKSHERMLKARAWAKRKIEQLFEEFPKINNCITNADGTITVKFIDVFEHYQDIDTVITGTMKSAKKKRLAEYDNKRNFPLLQQRFDDDVPITLFPKRFAAWKARN